MEKMVDTVNDLPNVLYEIANEPAAPASGSIAWMQHMVDHLNAYQALNAIAITGLMPGHSQVFNNHLPLDPVLNRPV